MRVLLVLIAGLVLLGSPRDAEAQTCPVGTRIDPNSPGWAAGSLPTNLGFPTGIPAGCTPCNGGRLYDCAPSTRTGLACSGNTVNDSQTCAPHPSRCPLGSIIAPGMPAQSGLNGNWGFAGNALPAGCSPCLGGPNFNVGVGDYRVGTLCSGTGTSSTQSRGLLANGRDCFDIGGPGNGFLYRCAYGERRTGPACIGTGWSDTQTCGTCGNGGANYACPAFFRKVNDYACPGNTSADTNACVPCANGGATGEYRCAAGNYRAGFACSGNSTEDTQFCMQCNGGTEWNCGTGNRRISASENPNSSACTGTTNTNTQLCATCGNAPNSVYSCQPWDYKSGSTCTGVAFTDTQTCGSCAIPGCMGVPSCTDSSNAQCSTCSPSTVLVEEGPADQCLPRNDGLFQWGVNEVVVEVVNPQSGAEVGCFGFALDVTAGAQTVSLRSNANWKASTTTASGPLACGTDRALSSPVPPPAAATFTVTPSGSGSSACDAFCTQNGLTNCSVLPTGNNNRFFRSTFTLPSTFDLDAASARLRMVVDDGARVLINGEQVAIENDCATENRNAALPLEETIAADGTVAVVRGFDSVNRCPSEDRCAAYQFCASDNDGLITCQQCPTGRGARDRCLPCSPNTYPNGFGCTTCRAVPECMPGKTTCTTSSDSRCMQCAPGYLPVDGGRSCMQCTPIDGCGVPETCTTTEDSRCEFCDWTYWKEAGDASSPDQCHACADAPHCVPGMTTCADDTITSCNECEPGYYVEFGIAYSEVAGADVDAWTCEACTPIPGCAAGALTCYDPSMSFCMACDDGFTLQPDGTCVGCPAGTVNVDGACVSCAANQIVIGSVCVTCPTGQVANASNACVSCPSDTYASASGCVPCGDVPYCLAETCSTATDATCVACEPGFYGTGSSSCTQCTEVEHCGFATGCTNALDSTCATCDPGFFLQMGVRGATADTCVSCPSIAGCVSPQGCYTADDSQCTGCETGRYLKDGLPDSCPVCTQVPHCRPDVMETCTTESDSFCAACEFGYYRTGAQRPSVCAACPLVEGCIVPGGCTTASDAQCGACESGRYLADGARDLCPSCTQIDHCTSPLTCTSAGDSRCLSCTPGFVVVSNGAADVCQQCEAGSISIGNTCVACQLDQIVLDNACVQCPPGEVSVNNVCTPCAAGSYASPDGCQACTGSIANCAALTCTNASDTTCAACEPRFWADSETSCTSCGEVEHCTSEVTCSSPDDLHCAQCESPGYFLANEGGSDSCRDCTPVPGCVSPVTCQSAGDSQCTTCAFGTYLANGPADACPACTPVENCMVQPSCTSATTSTCTVCKPGHYRQMGAPDTCPACSPVEHCTSPVTCNRAVNSQCTQCEFGFYLNNDTLASKCDVCREVEHCAVSGGCRTEDTAQCTRCDDGYVLVDGWSDLCEPCPVGQITVDGVCVACAANEIAVNNACVSCPSNQVSNGSNACVACPAENYADATGCHSCNGISGCEAVSCTSPSNSTCVSCNDGSWGAGTATCSSCTPVPYCATSVACSTAFDSQCGQCLAGFYRDDGVIGDVCAPCTAVEHCITPVVCTNAFNAFCAECEPGFYVMSGFTGGTSCGACAEIPHCATQVTCTSAFDATCESCEPGYRLAENGDACIPACAADEVLVGNDCEHCPDGQIAANGACVACPSEQVVRDNACVDLCAGVSCPAPDQCRGAGTCDWHTGACVDHALANGTTCDDANPETIHDTCTSGTCGGIPDADEDGLLNAVDNCPWVANVDQADLDGDHLGDACDADDDGDGVLDVVDNCPTVPNADRADTDRDGHGDACDADDDGDGVSDDADNCPLEANANQSDIDEDALGDACDADDDQDGVIDLADNCPTVANPTQVDLDFDGLGDACDADDDGDGVSDDADNCVAIGNPDQVDRDGDGAGDACDGDADGDGVIDELDNCSTTANADQGDLDGDGDGDACDSDLDGDGVPNEFDNCPSLANANQADADGDALGNACDLDDDDDGDEDADDNCPFVPNADQGDKDADGLGDACDTDDDGDGVSDTADACGGTTEGEVVDATGCSIAQLCPCFGPAGQDVEWKNHGQYVSCVAKTVTAFRKQGRITAAQESQLVSEAGQSSCGKNPCQGKSLKNRAGGNATAVVLKLSSVQSWNGQGPGAGRVFAGTSEIVANAAGEFVVPLRNASGVVIQDALKPNQLESSSIPRGAVVVLRNGDGRVTQGLVGFMRNHGKVATVATSQVRNGIRGAERNLSFENQGNGTAVLGTVSRDEYWLQPSQVLMHMTVTTAADLMEMQVCE